MIKKYLFDFMKLLESGRIEIYNEFSLQHELGIFLRTSLPDFKVQFERNAKLFNILHTIKHEIDIVVYNDTQKYAVELKYPINGQYPEQMFSFIKDICFMEQLKMSGFDNTYCLTIVEDKNFYSGLKRDRIYGYFRDRQPISGRIYKPTGTKDESVILKNQYIIDWYSCHGKRKFYIIDTKRGV